MFFNNETQLLPAWISGIPYYRRDLYIYSDASSRCCWYRVFFLSKYNSNVPRVPKPHGSGTLNLGVGMSV